MKRWIKVAVPLGIAAVLVAVLAIGLGSQSIDAAPGGNGNGKALGNGNGNGNGGSATATLTITPNPVGAGQEFTVSGSGFEPDELVVIAVSGGWGDFATADSTGAFSYTRSLREPWTYTFDALQQVRRNKWVIMASATLTVEP